MKMNRNFHTFIRPHWLVIVLMGFVWTACGGGGGGGGHDTHRAFFLADRDTPGKSELYMADLGSMVISKLNHDLADDEEIEIFQISPDGHFAAYNVHDTISNLYTLYVVDRDDRTTPVYVTENLDDIVPVAWSPNSQHVAFCDDPMDVGKLELYIMQPDGSHLRRINTELAGSLVRRFAWSPDSARMAYIADQERTGVFDLFVTAIDTAAPQRINPTLPDASRSVSIFKWSPQGDRLAFKANYAAADQYELYIAASNGSGGTVVDMDLYADETIGRFQWSPHGNQLALVSTSVSMGDRLHGCDRNGQNLTQISTGTGISIYMMAWSPDSALIAYISDEYQSDEMDLFTILPDGSGKRRLSESLDGPRRFVTSYEWSNSGEHIAFTFTSISHDLYEHELFAARSDGTFIGRISHDMIDEGGIGAFCWVPGNRQIIYTADAISDTNYDLYMAPADGTAQTEMISGHIRASAGGKVQLITTR